MTVCAQIHILSPDELVRDFELDHGIVYGTTATFGSPYYGQRVLGRLVYGESKRGHRHCSDDDYHLAEADEADSENRDGADAESSTMLGTGKALVTIVLVYRGKCTFVTKAKTAERKHAHAMIVVDRSNKTSEEIQRVVMADDGYGDDVRIPTMMVSRRDGEKLIHAARRTRVVVELAWDIPRAEVVVVDFWMSAGSGESSLFLSRFRDSAETLRYHLQFVPHYHVFSLPPGVGQAGKLCIDKESRYCAPDPDGPGPVTGADVAKEDLRQLCVWHITARRDPSKPNGVVYSKEFWDYVGRLSTDCPMKGKTSDHRFGDRCNNRVLGTLPVPVDAEVQKCMTENAEKFLEAEVRNTAWSAQALRLNGWRYSGPLDPEVVLKAVCHGFLQMPTECTDLLNSYGPVHWRRWLPSVGLVFWVLLLTVVVPVSACCIYRRILSKRMLAAVREEVMLEVQSQMTTYAPLQDSRPLTAA